MPEVTFRALRHTRHTHVSQLIDAGGDIATISARLGHAGAAVTPAIHTHPFKKSGDKASDGINKATAGHGGKAE